MDPKTEVTSIRLHHTRCELAASGPKPSTRFLDRLYTVHVDSSYHNHVTNDAKTSTHIVATGLDLEVETRIEFKNGNSCPDHQISRRT